MRFGPYANVWARVILWLNDYNTVRRRQFRPREVRLMHTGGDVKADRLPLLAGARDELRARGVNWG